MMKFMQKSHGTASRDLDNSSELNNNKNPRQFDNREDADSSLTPSNSAISSSISNQSNQSSCSSHTKTPTHFHHPDYVKETTSQGSPKVLSLKHVVNVHPESGVDYTSIMDQNQRSWQASPSPSRSSYRRSWYSRWEDKIDEEVTEKFVQDKEEKRKRNTKEIMKLPCSLGKMVIVEQEKLEADMERQSLDPRWTSRSPNASNKVFSKPRFKNPVNASPSRTLREAREQTQSVQCLVTRKDDNVNNNYSTAETDENHEVNVDNGTFILVNDDKRIPKGTSMPEIAGNVKLFPYHILSTRNQRLPKGVDRTKLEQHLTYKEFYSIFGMTRDEFWKLPKWKRMEMKKKVDLF